MPWHTMLTQTQAGTAPLCECHRHHCRSVCAPPAPGRVVKSDFCFLLVSPRRPGGNLHGVYLHRISGQSENRSGSGFDRAASGLLHHWQQTSTELRRCLKMGLEGGQGKKKKALGLMMERPLLFVSGGTHTTRISFSFLFLGSDWL